MLIPLIIVVVVAAGLLAMYLQARSSGAESRAEADRLETERNELSEMNTRLVQESSTAHSENKTLGEQLESTAAEVRRLGDQLDKARAAGQEQAARLDSQSEEIGVLVADNKALQTKVQAAETAAAAVIARDTGVVIGQELVGSAQTETLWDLELARSERTWRTSVATNPDVDQSPFEHTDDPVRLAVEIEAGALRENVGASVAIDWEAVPITDPARAHLVVRVAQELLEAAARSPEPSRLVVRGDEELVLTLEAAEDGDEVINIIPPRITSDLVELREEAGVSITVKSK